MANLFWKSKETTTRLVETPFCTEEEFEGLIFATPEILEDIFMLKRQIRGGTKQGIPDIVGLDKKMTRYGWKEAIYYIEPGKTKVEDFIRLFEKAYRRLTGK